MRFAVGEAYDGALLRSFLKKEVGISTALLSRLKITSRGFCKTENALRCAPFCGKGM